VSPYRCSARVEQDVAPTRVDAPTWLHRIAVAIYLLTVGAHTAMAASGCAAGQNVVKVAEAGVRLGRVAGPILVGAYESVQRECLLLEAPEQAPCVAEVRERWRPIREALADLHDAWCAVDPEAPECVKP
jgi:hypothetical protein